jgi:hypothetical protein
MGTAEGLSGFSNYLELQEHGWYKAGKEREKEYEVHSSPFSFMETTQSPSPQSYVDSSLILLAYPIALSKADLLLRMSLNRIASGDLVRMRRLGGDSGDGDRVTMLILCDLMEGVRGKDEYLFRLVNTPPFRLASEGLSSAANSLMIGHEPLGSWGTSGLVSSNARRLLSDEFGPAASFELLTRLFSGRSSGERDVLGLRSWSEGCAMVVGAESRTSVGGLGNWPLGGSG